MTYAYANQNHDLHVNGKLHSLIWNGIKPPAVGQDLSQNLLNQSFRIPGHVAQLVTCLTADTCLAADPGIWSLISARSHTFMEIDHEIISTVIPLPSSDSRRVVVSYKRKYMHDVLVNRLVKLAQEKVWLGEHDHTCSC